MERSEEQQMDHGRSAALPDRSADSRQICLEREAEREGRNSLPERRFRSRFSRAVQAGAGGCRRQRQGGRGSDLRSHRADDRSPPPQSLQPPRPPPPSSPPRPPVPPL